MTTTTQPAMNTQRDAVPPWLHAPGLYALLALMAIVAVWSRQSAWGDIINIVRKDEEASHIMLVPVVFVWLMSIYRHRFAGFTVRYPWAGLLIAAVGYAISIYGDVRAMALLWHFGAVVVLVGAVVAVLGVELLKRFWPAFVLLIFLLPVPGFIRQPIALWLQNISAQWVQQAVTLLGTDIHRAGNVLVVNGVDVGIAEACNGMRMVMMLFLVCYTFVFVNPLRAWVRVVLLLAAPLLALVTNVVRLVPTVLMYGYSSPTAADTFHTWLGWGMVIISYLLLTGVVKLLRWLLIPVMQEEVVKGAPHAAA